MDIFECLMKAGFTRHESVLYIALCKEGELTGYEASKISGVPRSNAYLALAGLVEKGGAYRIDSDVVKYTAVPVKELTSNIKRQMDGILDYLESNIPGREDLTDPFITVSGRIHIINKIKNIINNAAERIYISLYSGELELLMNEIADARNRGLKIVIITTPPFILEGAVVYYNEKQPGQIRLIADSEHVFTGEITGDETSTGLYSKNKNLIQLIKDSLTNEIKLIRIQQKS